MKLLIDRKEKEMVVVSGHYMAATGRRTGWKEEMIVMSENKWEITLDSE